MYEKPLHYPVLPSVFNPGYTEKVPRRLDGLLDVSDSLIAEAYTEPLAKLLRFFNNPSILDVGCGEGYLVKLLADMGYDVGGIDIDRIHKDRWLEDPALKDRCRLADGNAMVTSRAILPQSAAVIVSINIHDQTWGLGSSSWHRGPINPDQFFAELDMALSSGGIYFCCESDPHLDKVSSCLNSLGGYNETRFPSGVISVFQKS